MEPVADGAPPAGGPSPGATLPAPDSLSRFLAEPDPARAIASWLLLRAGRRIPADPESVRHFLQASVQAIDEVLEVQLDAVLHAPAFRRLEASWRGLRFLVDQTVDLGEAEAKRIKIRILSVSRRDLAKDLERAIEFDQSALFRKVYGEEFGTAGGEPFCVLLGDYELTAHPEDVSFLTRISGVAAAAFSPYIGAAAPGMFGVEHFRDLQAAADLHRIFSGEAYAKWKAFRQTEDARFVGLLVPRVLARPPWGGPEGIPPAGIHYREDVTAPDGAGYLWGTAVYCFGAILMRSFTSSGWLGDIRGIQEGVLGGGIVEGLPVVSFCTDGPGIAVRGPTDVALTDQQEREFGDEGFIALCRCKGTELAAFFGNPSVHSPPVLQDADATENAKLSATLQYIFCASRFAHYLKVLARDWVGSFSNPEDCQHELQTWLTKYCSAGDSTSLDIKARFPLREARVQVREVPGKQGVFYSVVHLRPHFQLDQVDATVKLVTVLSQIQQR
jgi:type VI secretion system ImpC/EvpB family protein